MIHTTIIIAIPSCPFLCLSAGFAGVYVYYWARSAIESFLSIYNDMRNIYNESEAKNQAQAAGTAALAA